MAVLRADAAPEIGGGHVYRCLVLADALAAAGWSCAFACTAKTPTMIHALSESRHEILVLESEPPNEPQALLHHWPDGCELLVVDHYGRDTALEGACRSWARRVMVIDDLADRLHDCDVLLDQTLGRSAGDYAALAPVGCDMLMGPHFALLRQQFAAARAASLMRRKNELEVRRILVSMGASDPQDATRTAIEGIAGSGAAAAIDVVVDVTSSRREDYEAIAGTAAKEITFHTSVQDMAGLMSSADLAVGAAGTTAWERCCLGLPTLMISTAGNQETIAAALAAVGAATNLGRHGTVKATDVSEAVLTLANDPGALSVMSENAANVCDGKGVTRVLERLAA